MRKVQKDNKKERIFLLMHLQSSPFSLLLFLTSLPLLITPPFNSPHPSFPGYGVAKRIMGNEMVYLRLPRGEIEKERGRKWEKERVRDKTKREGETEAVGDKKRHL